MDGIRWVAGEWRSRGYCLSFARGIDSRELAVRLGADPGEPPAEMTEAQALGMLDYESCYTVARSGELGGWSFAVESGAGSNALLESDRISSGGVELVHFNPQPDHPPSLFSYAKDGHSVCFFPFLSERVENGGSEPDLLVPAMKEFGVLDGEGRRVPWGDGQGQSAAEAMACTFAAIEAHFGLSLPRDAVVDGRLPTSVTVRDEPRFW